MMSGGGKCQPARAIPHWKSGVGHRHPRLSGIPRSVAILKSILRTEIKLTSFLRYKYFVSKPETSLRPSEVNRANPLLPVPSGTVEFLATDAAGFGLSSIRC